MIRQRPRDRPVSCRQCSHYRNCLERSRDYPCTDFKPIRSMSLWDWCYVGVALAVLFLIGIAIV